MFILGEQRRMPMPSLRVGSAGRVRYGAHGIFVGNPPFRRSFSSSTTLSVASAHYFSRPGPLLSVWETRMGTLTNTYLWNAGLLHRPHHRDRVLCILSTTAKWASSTTVDPSTDRLTSFKVCMALHGICEAFLSEWTGTLCCPQVLCKVYYLAPLMFSISHPWRCSRLQYNSSSVSRPFMVLIRIQKFGGVVLVNASVEKSWGWLPHSSSFRHRKAALTVAPGVGLDHAQRK
ncbi:hypothetical protein BJV77DRAFT_640686 [Russula vinacea]|nr:hypothetical protein BJV77DRAFT_640686 [Russula vinacea]